MITLLENAVRSGHGCEDWYRTWVAGRTIDHAEKDLEESQRGSGQDATVCRCPLEQELLGRLPQGHNHSKATFRDQTAHIDDSLVRISTLELPECDIKRQDEDRLVVLAQCPVLGHLDLSCNFYFEENGIERLAGVLGQCRELEHLNFKGNDIRSVMLVQRGLHECWCSAKG